MHPEPDPRPDPSFSGHARRKGGTSDRPEVDDRPSADEVPARVIFTEARPLIMGVVLFEGFEPLDVFGPVEIFGSLGSRVRILTLAGQTSPVRPRFGPTVGVDREMGDTETLDLLLIPGGIGTRSAVDDAPFLSAIRCLAASTPRVATVCTGSGLLARTGLLSGRRATSNKQSFAWAVSQDRTVQWVYEARWVMDGKYATSSGVSAGMDLALALVSSLFDLETARAVARYVEYSWNEDSGHDPFAVAGGFIP